MDLNIDILQRAKKKPKKQEQESAKKYENKNKNLKNENQEKIPQNQDEPNRDDFKIQPVRGDGNCLLRAVLASANIDEEKHIYLRKILVNLIQKIDFSEEILEDYGFNNKQQMITHVAKEGEKLGLDTLQILLDEFNISIYIWHDNNISGKKWII